MLRHALVKGLQLQHVMLQSTVESKVAILNLAANTLEGQVQQVRAEIQDINLPLRSLISTAC